MAIGRSEDRDTPGNPSMLRHRVHVRDPIRVAHLGLRSTRPHTQAGHMTAIDQTHFCCKTLQTGGRPHMGSGLAAARRPGMTGEVATAETRLTLPALRAGPLPLPP